MMQPNNCVNYLAYKIFLKTAVDLPYGVIYNLNLNIVT